MKKLTVLIMLLLGGISLIFAQKSITLEAIWKDYAFSANSVPGFNFMKDGKHYTRLEQNKIMQYDLTTGQPTQTLFDPATAGSVEGFNQGINSYTFSEDESRILIASEQEAIYRHSTQSLYFVLDRKSKKLSPVFTGGKIRLATFNPQADRLAFVYENNLFVKDLQSNDIRQVTTDGKMNEIINGATDWVYEEEFSFDQGFAWSPDGKRVAFYRFDEREVPEFTMTNYHNELYPQYITWKYPKVGEQNSKVSIHIFDTGSGKTIKVDTETGKDHYIPRIKWTSSSDQLCVMRMNRHQNELELLLADVVNGKTKLLFKETNKYYISDDVLDNLAFLKDGKHFIWTSENSGWNHIYLYDMNGKLVRPVTQGEWEVSELYGVDEQRQLVYYQAAEKSPLERQVYSMSLEGKRKQKLADEAGWNSAQFSSNYDYYVVTHSTINQPATYTVYDHDAKEVRMIEDNADLVQMLDEYDTQPLEFFQFTTSEKVSLNGWMIKPQDFNPNRKYPVFMYLYGGPGSQQVTDRWKGQDYWWFQMLADQGFLVACVDNRGTGGRGEEFMKMTYLKLGHYETIDQIEAAKYLGSLAYTDPQRIGIFGWSYGGYMSSLCLLKGNDVFKAAIAVAPVTNWKWYDTIYTERYMRTEKENPDGYRENSPVNFADRLKGEYLLVHGMGDDNVHFQNTVEMANALIAANKQFDTYFYPNRNHGIYGGPTRLHLYTKMTSFLDEKLKGQEKPAAKMEKIKIEDPEKMKMEEKTEDKKMKPKKVKPSSQVEKTKAASKVEKVKE